MLKLQLCPAYVLICGTPFPHCGATVREYVEREPLTRSYFLLAEFGLSFAEIVAVTACAPRRTTIQLWVRDSSAHV